MSFNCCECCGDLNIKFNCQLLVVTVGDRKFLVLTIGDQMFFDLFDKNFGQTKTFCCPNCFQSSNQKWPSIQWLNKKLGCCPKTFEHCSKNSIIKFLVTKCHDQNWRLNSFSRLGWWPNFSSNAQFFWGKWPKFL